MWIDAIDLNFQRAREVTASFLLLGNSSAALIETGPATCLGSLVRGLEERGVSPEDVRQVFLTHIHLDHAGASGHLAGLLPNATFYVHDVGYPHIADPLKLVDSATRVYGETKDELWGEMRPVPEDRLVSLKGGEELEVAGGVLLSHYTPGHAYHHLAYLEPESGSLFAGDVAGIRLPDLSYVRPPTSPPDLDVEAWKDSITLIREIAPSSLWPTHFGRFDDVERHLGELERRLDDWLCFAEGLVGQGKSRAEVAEELSAKAEAEFFADRGGPKEAGRYRLAGEVWVFAAGLWHHATRRRQGSEINTRAGCHPNHLPTQERPTMNDQNVPHSEWEAETYHRLSDPQFSWGLRVLEDLELQGDEVVLDAGCGTGRLTAELLKRLPRGRVIAVDRSRNMLRAAAGYLRPPFGERVRFVRADLQTLRLEETVDGVFSTATFHWVCDHSLLFRCLYEVLKPGGWLHAQCGGRGNLSRVLRRASSLMAQAPFSRFFSGWPGPWEYADDATTAERLRAAGYVDVRTSLEPASVRLPNAEAYRSFLTSVVFHEHLARVPDDELRSRFTTTLTEQAASDDPPFELDYRRLNLQGEQPANVDS